MNGERRRFRLFFERADAVCYTEVRLVVIAGAGAVVLIRPGSAGTSNGLRASKQSAMRKPAGVIPNNETESRAETKQQVRIITEQPFYALRLRFNTSQHVPPNMRLSDVCTTRPEAAFQVLVRQSALFLQIN